jgi:hypothetical protein
MTGLGEVGNCEHPKVESRVAMSRQHKLGVSFLEVVGRSKNICYREREGGG